MERILLIFACFLVSHPGITQSVKNLMLQDAYRRAMDHHPLGDKAALLDQSTELEMERLESTRLPEISLLADARLQSENVKLPFEIPGQEPFELPLFIAQAAVDARYVIYDGGATQARREATQAGLMADQQRVITDLARLKENINEPFFNILLLREQQKILEINLADLQSKITQLEAGVRHGAVLESDVDKLRVEALRLESRIEQTRGQIRALFDTLSDLTGEQVDENTELNLPDLSGFAFSDTLTRPELELYDLEKRRILANEALITADRRPKVSAYAQAGFGYPNPLNFFDKKFSPFALAGVRFSWKIFDWNKTSVDRQLMTVQSHLIDNQKAVFEHNISVQEANFRENINVLEQLIERDRVIVELQEKILSQVSAQLDQGVITSVEYVDQVNAGIRSNLDLETHRLQLQQLKVDYLTKKGML